MTDQNQTFKFFSTSKFAQTMNQLAKDNKLAIKLDNNCISFIHVWFRGNECYEGKFDDIQIRNPIYMKIHISQNKDLFLNQEQIIKLFDCKPIICIKQNMYRLVPKGKDRDNLYFAFIDFEQRESKQGYYYFPVDLYKENSKNRIATIEKQFENVDKDAL